MTGDEALVVATEALRNIVRLEGITAELVARKALLIMAGADDGEAEENAVSAIVSRDAQKSRAQLLERCVELEEEIDSICEDAA
jgi:predicted regulator of Ras-like GTPase activity (Roadblock/LC7/MglB family)